MDLNATRIYCAEQIEVPPLLPAILREYTKAVIRKQPSGTETDPQNARMRLYQWSAEYFRGKLAEKKSASGGGES